MSKANGIKDTLPWDDVPVLCTHGCHIELCFDCALRNIEEVKQLHARMNEIRNFLLEQSNKRKTVSIQQPLKEFFKDLSL